MNRRAQIRSGTLVGAETMEIVEESIHKIKGYLKDLEDTDQDLGQWISGLCSRLASAYVGTKPSKKAVEEYGRICLALGMYICDCENDGFWRTMFGINGPKELNLVSQAFSSGSMPKSDVTGSDKAFNERRELRELAEEILSKALEAARHAKKNRYPQ